MQFLPVFKATNVKADLAGLGLCLADGLFDMAATLEPRGSEGLVRDDGSPLLDDTQTAWERTLSHKGSNLWLRNNTIKSLPIDGTTLYHHGGIMRQQNIIAQAHGNRTSPSSTRDRSRCRCWR